MGKEIELRNVTRVGMISDLHYKISRKNNKFIRHVTDAVNLFVRECRNRQVDLVVLLGDIFDLKFIIDTVAQDTAIRDLRTITDEFPTVMIVGNHETVYRANNEINILRMFSSDALIAHDYQNLTFGNTTLHFLPYFQDDIVLNKVPIMRRALNKQKNNKHYLFTHLGLRGFDFVEGHEDVWSELSVNDIDVGFERIFTGHLHHHQTIGKTTVVSSPIESHFNEGGDHGFVFLDVIKNSFKFVRNFNSPRFYEFDLTRDNLEKIGKLDHKAYLRIKVNEHIDPRLLYKYKRKLEKKHHFVSIRDLSRSAEEKIVSIDGWGEWVAREPQDILIDWLKTQIEENDFLKDYEVQDLMHLMVDKPGI